jgi:hypothetical protein
VEKRALIETAVDRGQWVVDGRRWTVGRGVEKKDVLRPGIERGVGIEVDSR